MAAVLPGCGESDQAGPQALTRLEIEIPFGRSGFLTSFSALSQAGLYRVCGEVGRKVGSMAEWGRSCRQRGWSVS